MDSKPKNDIGKGRMSMSDEERRELAEKLDQELDEFIGGLEKRSSTYEWQEDRWQEVRFHTKHSEFLPWSNSVHVTISCCIAFLNFGLQIVIKKQHK